MGSLLSDLLSSKGKPIICNGKLLMYGRQLIFAREDTNYRVVFTATSRNNEANSGSGEINLTMGEGSNTEEQAITEKSVIQGLLDFDRKYAPAWGRSPESVTAAGIVKGVDPYTGAVVLESELYHRMMDPKEFHRSDRNYDAAAMNIRVELLLDYVNNYYDIYRYLFNRRLMATHMSPFVKGHLVAGLFQPVICSTELIRSPMEYPALSGFMSLLHGDTAILSDGGGNIEIQLEPTENSNRGLKLTCVSMYDFVQRFHPEDENGEGNAKRLYVPRQLDKRLFMFVLMYLMSGIVNRGYNLPVPLEERHAGLLRDIEDRPELQQFKDNTVLGYLRLASQVATI